MSWSGSLVLLFGPQALNSGCQLCVLYLLDHLDSPKMYSNTDDNVNTGFFFFFFGASVGLALHDGCVRAVRRIAG